MNRPRLVILGSLLYDCVIYGPRLPRKGETIIGKRNGFFSGGKGANQAVQAARMGAEVYFIGRVGDDDIGRNLVATLEREGINTEFISRDPHTATGTCCIHVDEQGDNAIMIAPLANLTIGTEDIERAATLIASGSIFLTQLEVNLDAIGCALERASSAKVPVVLNPAPASRIDVSLFSCVDFITPNETEAEFFSGILPDPSRPQSLREAAGYFLDRGTGNAVITLGEKGCYFRSSTEEIMHPPIEIDAVDSTAAGDAFNAAFAVSLAEGADIRGALEWGNGAGALAASRAGAQPSLGSRMEIEKRMLSAAV